MTRWFRGVLYLFAVVLGLLLVLIVMVFATIDPYADEDMSRGGICERSGDIAPECAMPLEDPDKVLDALLACDTGFFKVLAEEKAAFGRAEIQPLAYNLLDSEEPRVTVVRFREPVEAYGLHLTGYVQRTAPNYASWGFHVIEGPAEAAKAIEARHPGKKFSQQDDSLRQQISSADPQTRWVVISPPKEVLLPGTSLYCQHAGTAIEEMPDGFDLFLSKSFLTNFAQRFDAFTAAADKTISDLAR